MIPPCMTTDELEEAIDKRYRECQHARDVLLHDFTQVEYEGETLDYWEGALTSAAVALNIVRKYIAGYAPYGYDKEGLPR